VARELQQPRKQQRLLRVVGQRVQQQVLGVVGLQGVGLAATPQQQQVGTQSSFTTAGQSKACSEVTSSSKPGS
jgi:hypothetical protein